MLGAAMTEDLRESPPAADVTGAALDPGTLWAEFAPPLRGFLARRVPPGVDPDDLVQEVFLRVVRHVASLRERTGQASRADLIRYARPLIEGSARM